MNLLLNLILAVITLGLIACLSALVVKFLMQSFVLPVVLPRVGKETTGQVTNIAVRTYSGSYGRRFIKTYISYEFYVGQTRYWYQKSMRGQSIRLGRGDVVQVFYMPGLPMVHWVQY